LPPSSENACSNRHEFVVMSDQTFRTRMVLPLKWFLIEKLAASVLELADRWLAQSTALAVGSIEAPLVGLGIV
jgi:hypothetical protein